MRAASHYRTALRTPGARGPVIAALLGRLPVAMVGFSFLLYTQRVTGTYAVAGLVSAAVLVGVALGSAGQSRLIDRIGPTRPLLGAAAAFAIAVTAAVVAVERGAPAPVLVLFGLAVGTSQPTIGSTSRAMWTALLPPGPVRTAAFTYEAVITEVYFIVGPALSGLLLTAPWPGTGVAVGAALMVAGTVWYALTPTMLGTRPTRGAGAGRRSGSALASPGLRTVSIAAVGLGLILGFVEVAVPAATTRAGHPAAGGVLLGLWSVSSAVFGLLYGIRPWPRSLPLRMPALLAGFALLMVPLAVAPSLVALTALLLAGALITPQTATESEAVERVGQPGRITEAFGWIVTAATLGIGAGHATGGYLVERAGIGITYLVAAGLGVTLAGAVFLRRDTLRQSTEDASLSEPVREQQWTQ